MDFSLFKKHPAILVGVAIVGAYIFYELAIAGSSSSGGGAMVSTGQPNGAYSYGAGNSGQVAGLQAQVQAHQDDISAALAGQAADNATKITLATLAAQTSTTQQGVAVGGTLDLAKITGSVQEWLAGNSSTTQIELNKDNNATALANQKLMADTSTALATISSNTTLSYADIASKTSLGMASIQGATTLGLASIQGDVTNHQIDANSAVTIEAIKSRASSDNTKSWLGAAASIIGAFL